MQEVLKHDLHGGHVLVFKGKRGEISPNYATVISWPCPSVPYHPPGHESLALAVIKLASDHHAVLLANHGPVVSGTSLSTALFATEKLEETAKLFLLLRGSETGPLLPNQLDELTKKFLNQILLAILDL